MCFVEKGGEWREVTSERERREKEREREKKREEEALLFFLHQSSGGRALFF